MSQPPSSLDGLRIQRDQKPRNGPNVTVVTVLVVAIVIAGLLLWWFSRPRAIAVRTTVARSAATNAADHVVLNASGYVTARREATVSSKITGKVVDVLVEEGSRVVQDQILAHIDPTNIDSNLQLARAQEAAAKASIDETKARVEEADQELRRQTELMSRKVAAQSDFDHAQADALAQRGRLEQQQAEIAVAERTVAVWQQQLEDTIIRAPFAGTVTSKNAQPGEMISPMSTGGFTRTGICTIVDMTSLEIEIDVNESYINRVQVGQPVEATLDAYPDWKIPCHVIAIIPTADRSKSTVRVRVAFDRLGPRILPEMSVKVAFRERAGASSLPRGVIVPQSSLLRENGRAYVMVVRNGRAEKRAVVSGASNGDDASITLGLASGEHVVINVPPSLSDGESVTEVSQ